MTEQKQNKKAKKKQKKIRVLSMGFVLSSLFIAILTFYVCFSIGMNMYNKLPF